MKGRGVVGVIIFILAVMTCLWRASEGCIEDERVALLELQSSFSVRCRRDDDGDCCEWDGVECNSTTGRVTLLSPLELMMGFAFEPTTSTEWYFNASLFLPFQQLTTLDLQFIGMVGCAENQGFERLSRLKRLESLDLSGNYRLKDKGILSAIGTISSLRSLNLSDSGLETTDDIQGLLRLENLEHLNLDFNNFNSSIFSFLSGLSSLRSLYVEGNKLSGTIDSKELSKLGKLEDLRLFDDNCNNSILQSVAALSSLRTLGLRGCELKGIIDLQEIGVTRNLSALYLEHGYFIRPANEGGATSIQLRSLGAYPNLKTISLFGYHFEGPAFIQEEGEMSNVEELIIEDSYLNEEFLQNLESLSSLKRLSLRSYANVTIPAQGFPNFEKLEYLDMSYLTLNNSILKYIEKMISLKSLSLSGCGLSGSFHGLCKLNHLEELYIGNNDFSGSLPWCIANLTSLVELDLSGNHFTGSISMSPLRSLTSLQFLSFSGNLFRVPVSLEPFFNHSNLKYLYGEDNLNIYEDHVRGIDSTPRFQLEFLSLSNHGDTGGFPQFLFHQHNLWHLDLSHIQLKGEFPNWLLGNNTKLRELFLANTSLSGPFHLPSTHANYLDRLDVSKNSFNGTIPIEIGQMLPSLFELDLSQNCLVGSIPPSFGKICRLMHLDLSSNELSGKIPEEFRYSTQLTILDASNNSLSGRIPRWIANMSSLEVLDLSVNNFFGNLPTPPSNIKDVYLSENKLQGSLGAAFYNFSELMTLDLSHNYLGGKIPKWIGKLPKLSYLLMSHNNLEGEIPIKLCSLEQLSLVDFSNNNLSGHAPSCIRAASKYMKTEEGDFDPYLASAPSYMEQPLEFTTKSLTLQFKGSILKYISGIDLSCNNLSGTIPAEFGNLNMIQVLNLSHNSFKGPIPKSFSNLIQIESLDLSYNNLDGNIPSQILGLNFISHFSVAHNNLSGRTPEMVAQFATFDNTSYEGNPFLCGPPLLKLCSPTILPNSTNTVEEDDDDDDVFMDMQIFYTSCVVSYMIVLLSIAAILYVNSYWRRRWFYMIEVSITNCYYFFEDNILYPLSSLDLHRLCMFDTKIISFDLM